ncbi:MAG TPA: hypothetical protein VG125_27405 [Pirellulales bacterium]|jgi:hypothetical protein|nr:hypothetical protein [Pirellulales bacterium]
MSFTVNLRKIGLPGLSIALGAFIFSSAARGHESAAAPPEATGEPVAAVREPFEALPVAHTKREASGGSAARQSGELDRLVNQVQRVLNHYYSKRVINTNDQNCWEVMHWIIAYGVRSRIMRGGAEGSPVNSIGWLCWGGRCAGQPLVLIDQGRIAAAKGVHVQGHHGQFLAILAQAKVMKDYPMRVGNRSFTVADLIETEKLGCQTGMELTFKLIALSHYLDLNETWLNSTGEEWSVSRLVQEEIKSPINGAACGGTHRLMGLSYAVHERLKRGEPLDGQFERADIYISDFHRYTFGLQNPDGSFSTDWFKGRQAKPDLERRLQTTGHILEWLVYSVPPEALTDPRLLRAVDFLSTMLSKDSDKEWPIGTLGHGLHSLAMFNERVLKEHPSVGNSMARRRGRTSPSRN